MSFVHPRGGSDSGDNWKSFFATVTLGMSQWMSCSGQLKREKGWWKSQQQLDWLLNKSSVLSWESGTMQLFLKDNLSFIFVFTLKVEIYQTWLHSLSTRHYCWCVKFIYLSLHEPSKGLHWGQKGCFSGNLGACEIGIWKFGPNHSPPDHDLRAKFSNSDPNFH